MKNIKKETAKEKNTSQFKWCRKCQEEAQKLIDQNDQQKKRFLAEMANTTNQFNRSLHLKNKFRSKDLAKSLLETIDIFKKALSFNCKQDETKKFLVGVKMVYQNLEKVLNDFNIKKIDVNINDPFDPLIHQGIEVMWDPKYKNNAILKILNDGYKIHDHLLRPVKVVVNQKKMNDKNEKKIGGKENE